MHAFGSSVRERYKHIARDMIGSALYCIVVILLNILTLYSATSNDMKLVHWPLMGGLLHLVQRGGDWVGPQPAQAPLRCTKCSSPRINGQCTNHCIVV